jgi:predicted hydrolase (HD superfamily)
MTTSLTREAALELFKRYNTEPFHLQHALTVEGVMRYFALDLGYGSEADFWATVGLLHDIDFGRWPQEHCKKAPELLREAGAGEDLIHAVVSHGWGICSDVEPVHEMEKVLFATDELTGLIWATAIVRPSKSVADLETKSVKKKFKTPAFAAGCSREVIQKGAEMLGLELDALIGKTILAMRAIEGQVSIWGTGLRFAGSFVGGTGLDLGTGLNLRDRS